MTESLMERTRRLLREAQDDGRSLGTICAEMQANGSGISFYWLRKFSSGDVEDPSVNRVEELFRHLTGHAPYTDA